MSMISARLASSVARNLPKAAQQVLKLIKKKNLFKKKCAKIVTASVQVKMEKIENLILIAKENLIRIFRSIQSDDK